MYGRDGLPCRRCGTTITKTRVGGRGHLVLPSLPAVGLGRSTSHSTGWVRAVAPARPRLGRMGRTYKTEAVRAALVPARGGRPSPASVHARSRTGGGGREGGAQDEVALRRSPRALLARGAHAAPGLRGAAHRHGRVARRSAPARERGSIPAVGRPRRRRGDAAPVRRGGAERARLRGADAFLRGARRSPGRVERARVLSIRSRSPSSSSCSGSRATCPISRDVSSAAGRRRWSATSRARAVPCARRARRARRSCSRRRASAASSQLLWTPLAETHGLGLGERAVRDVLAVVVATYEFHGGFRLRTLAASS